MNLNTVVPAVVAQPVQPVELPEPSPEEIRTNLTHSVQRAVRVVNYEDTVYTPSRPYWKYMLYFFGFALVIFTGALVPVYILKYDDEPNTVVASEYNISCALNGITSDDFTVPVQNAFRVAFSETIDVPSDDLIIADYYDTIEVPPPSRRFLSEFERQMQAVSVLNVILKAKTTRQLDPEELKSENTTAAVMVSMTTQLREMNYTNIEVIEAVRVVVRGVVQVSGPSPSVTPSPSSSVAPSVTPSSAPSSSSSLAPSVSPSSSSSVVPSTTPSPTPSSTPSSTPQPAPSTDPLFFIF